MRPARDPRQHWRRNRAAIAVLLAVWGALTFGVAWFAPSLDWNFFGWRFSFYMSAQGTPLACLALVAFYAWYARRLDRRCGYDDEEQR